MKRAILILSLLHHMAMAQDCGSDCIDSAAYENLPWTNNNDYYINFYDSLITAISTLPESGLNAERVAENTIWLPTKAEIHRAGRPSILWRF